MTANRRLAAIMMADVVGYSRMMAADEAGTYAAMEERFHGVLEPNIAKFGGRVVKLMGDGVLVEFASAVNSVQAALEIQAQMAAASEKLPDGKQIILRIGINLGDVIGEGSDIYGDGVNVAARLEALALPGGIVISDKVEAEVRGKIASAFTDMGEQQLKNIDRPIRAFRSTGESVSGLSEGGASGSGKPTIAVLAFTSMSSEADQHYLSDGITEDIITELSRFRHLLVIARNSSFTFKGQSVDLREVGRKLGADYVVEGSVRKVGSRIRITAQLIDAKSGAHIWAERYDREFAEIFEVQDELVRTMVSTIGGRIESAGKAQAARLSDQGVRAYDLYLRAVACEDKNTREGYRNARQLLQQAIAHDPGFAPAYHHLSLVTYVEWMAFWIEDRDKGFADSLSAARHALTHDDSNSSLHAHLGMLLMYGGDYEEAAMHFNKSFGLNPNDAKARALHGFFLTAMGRADEALDSFDLASRLNPLQPDWSNWLKGIALFTRRSYGEALLAFRAIKVPMNEVRGWMAASYAHAGKTEEAASMLSAFLSIAQSEMQVPPEANLAAWTSFWHGAIPYKSETDREHLYAGLRKAGMPG